MQYLIVDSTLPPPHENVLWSPKIDNATPFSSMGIASAVKDEVLEATGVIASGDAWWHPSREMPGVKPGST
jgi:hypothetical protein